MRNTTGALTRRAFLRNAAAGAAALPFASSLLQASENESVTKVHVIFKTHLDIGFTDLAANVINTYLHDFVPTAIRLARDTREQQGDSRFKWTTGAWLIHTFLEKADAENRAAMEQAIAAGDICWHAMPFTTHSEALDASLFEAGLQLSKRLDARFGVNTVSAKMTDVPGHTRGIVPILHHGGVDLLHIGVNPASTPPDVPPIFVWQTPDDSSIVVIYQKDYGGVMRLPHTSEAVAIMFTGDNHGPQTAAQVMDAYERLQMEFPNAAIAASDLNEVTRAITPVISRLPVVRSELGDSWIHGIGSDPLRIAQLRTLARQRREWLRTGRLEKHGDTDLAFSIPLCMVGEHTWGLDVKTHLHTWDVYTPEALDAARNTPSFKRIEASWQEKRDYLREGMAALPTPLKKGAQTALAALTPVPPDMELYTSVDGPDFVMESASLAVALDPETGAIARLHNRKTGRNWASRENPLALLAYQSFSKNDYDRFMDQYLTSRPDWALKDFGKPGIEDFQPHGRILLPSLKAVWQREEEQWHALLAAIEVLDETGAPVPGCPRKFFVEYRGHKREPILDITLQWFEKQANRLPEALWFSFMPAVNEDGAWTLDKMGQVVDPRDVVNNGGHKMHAVAGSVHYADTQGALFLRTFDAPLVAPGERSLLRFDNVLPAPENGMHFCLYNNVWGTNFAMWFEDNMRFRFHCAC